MLMNFEFWGKILKKGVVKKKILTKPNLFPKKPNTTKLANFNFAESGKFKKNFYIPEVECLLDEFIR
jgi:hypothetical protein